MKKADKIYEDFDLYEEQSYQYKDNDDDGLYEEEYYDDTEDESAKKTSKLLNMDGRFKFSPAIIAMIALAALFAVIIVLGAASFRSKISTLSNSNTDLMQQMANIRQNVYIATNDIHMGDKIVYNGAGANVELTQVYTSVDPTLYVTAEDEGLAQVDIKAGTPVTLAMVGDTDPNERMEPERIIEEVPVEEQIIIPYQITADYINQLTGEKIAESMELQLDAGSNEKAFNMKEAVIDGYVLKSIKIEGNSVHSFGAVKKNLKAGPVMLYYYTNKRGWARVEIKGNIRVEYAYVPEATVGEAEQTETVDEELEAGGVPVEEEAAVDETAEGEVAVDETAQENAVTEGEEMTADGEAIEAAGEEMVQENTDPVEENAEETVTVEEADAQAQVDEILNTEEPADDEPITFDSLQGLVEGE